MDRINTAAIIQKPVVSSVMQNSEREEIKKILAGETHIFETLIERYQHLVFSLAYRLVRDYEEARDLTQETFLRAYRFLSTYRDEYRFSTWLARITFNLYKDRFKKKRVGEVFEEDLRNKDGGNESIFFMDKGTDPSEIVEKNAKKNSILDVLARMPVGYRTLVVLYYFEEYSYEEMAKVLDIPVGTVKSRLSRAKEYMIGKYRKILENWM